MGVPTLDRALHSATDALTLVVEDVIHPFDGNGRMREMHLHALPWPTEALLELGGEKVEMRVTLSYFIEPNPGSRGWVRRYSYASHGLRFDVRRVNESTDDFRKRINQLARAEEERRPAGPGGDPPRAHPRIVCYTAPMTETPPEGPGGSAEAPGFPRPTGERSEAHAEFLRRLKKNIEKHRDLLQLLADS